MHCLFLLSLVVSCVAVRVPVSQRSVSSISQLGLDIRNKSCFLFDLDGTIYSVRGGKKALLPGVNEVLGWLNETDKQWAFVTNTGSKSPKRVQETLMALKVNAPIEHILTAGDLTAQEVAKLPAMAGKNPTAYVLGTDAVKSRLRELGVKLVEEVDEFAKDGHPDVVVISASKPDADWSFAALSAATKFVSRGARFIASAPDMRSMTPDGPIPAVGAFVRLIEGVTGKNAEVIGKPQTTMLKEAMQRLGVTTEECVMVGDNLNTDIRSGINAGMDTMFLTTTGAHSSDDLDGRDIQPTMVVDSLLDFFHRYVQQGSNL